MQLILRHKWYGLLAIIVAVLAISAFFLPSTMTDLLTRVIIMALFATSLNLMVGYGGMLPLGQAMFLGIGAYSYAILVVKSDMSIVPAIILSLLLGIVVNAIIGYLCLRGETMTFGLLHIAFNIQISLIINKMLYLTGGDSGIGGVPRPDFVNSTVPFFFFVLAIVVVCIILLKIFVDSPFGRMVKGLRENEERMRFLGINTRGFQLVIFIIAGFFTCLAGILLAMLNLGAFPVYASPIMSAEGLMMCLIGGMSAFTGPALGALITTIISTELSNYVTQWQGVLGAIIVICAVTFREGILGRRKKKAKTPIKASPGLSTGEAAK